MNSYWLHKLDGCCRLIITHIHGAILMADSYQCYLRSNKISKATEWYLIFLVLIIGFILSYYFSLCTESFQYTYLSSRQYKCHLPSFLWVILFSTQYAMASASHTSNTANIWYFRLIVDWYHFLSSFSGDSRRWLFRMKYVRQQSHWWDIYTEQYTAASSASSPVYRSCFIFDFIASASLCHLLFLSEFSLLQIRYTSVYILSGILRQFIIITRVIVTG